MCEEAHAASGIGELFVATLSGVLGSVLLMEDAMPRINRWNQSVPRVELDQRSREARLLLERTERLFAVGQSRVRRVLYLFRIGMYRGAPEAIGSLPHAHNYRGLATGGSIHVGGWAPTGA